MQIEWIYGLLGGLMIGAAAAFYLLANGRIMGASGILGGLLDGTGRNTAAERIAFLVGLIVVPGLMVALGAGASSPAVAPVWLLIVAGLLVGFGTRVGNGCTSGHGVCGISRLSLRGIVATCAYLLAGGVAVLLVHALGWGL